MEVKHQVGRALVWKTRGAISTEPCDPTRPGKPVIARAGHRLDPRPEDQWQECWEWERLYRQRGWDWRRNQKVFVSLREQHEQDLDLVDVERSVRVNLEFDMKRRLVGVSDVDGLLAAGTEPWRTVDEFLEEREAFDLWRRSRRRVLRTAADHAHFPGMEGGAARQARGREQGRPTRAGGPVPPRLGEAGARTAGRRLRRARRGDVRGRLPRDGRRHQEGAHSGAGCDEHSLDRLSSADEEFLRWALARWPGFEIERLAVPGSPAAAAVAELRAAAVSVPLLLPGISACGTGTLSGSPAQVAPAE